MPQDMKLSPDGRVFYVADMMSAGSGRSMAPLAGDRLHPHRPRSARPLPEPRRPASLRIEPGRGHDLGRQLRDAEGGGDVADPGGGSPDMGGVSADGKTLWLSGRYDAEVYAIDTARDG